MSEDAAGRVQLRGSDSGSGESAEQQVIHTNINQHQPQSAFHISLSKWPLKDGGHLSLLNVPHLMTGMNFMSHHVFHFGHHIHTTLK